MEEIWRDIDGYEGVYQVSNFGRIKSLERVVEEETRWGGKMSFNYKGCIRKLYPDKDGYLICYLRNNGIGRNVRVHRVVAKAFLPQIEGRNQVNHKDGVKTNNHVDNLEWCSSLENNRHRCRVLGYKTKSSNFGPKRKIRCVELNWVFDGVNEAAKNMNLSGGNISYAAHNGCRAGGYHWEFVEQPKQALPSP